MDTKQIFDTILRNCESSTAKHIKFAKNNNFKLDDNTKRELIVNTYIRDFTLNIINRIEDDNLKEVCNIIENILRAYYNKTIVI